MNVVHTTLVGGRTAYIESLNIIFVYLLDGCDLLQYNFECIEQLTLHTSFIGTDTQLVLCSHFSIQSHVAYQFFCTINDETID